MVGCCRGESISKLIWPWSSNSRFPSVLAIPNRYPTRALFAGDDLCNCRDSDELHASRRFITSCHLNPPRFGPKTGDSKVRPATRDSKRSTFSTVHLIDKEVSTRRVSNRMFSTTWWEPSDMMMLEDAHEINYRHTRRQAILSTGHLYLTKTKRKRPSMIAFGICTFPFTLRPANYRTYRIPRRNIRGGTCTYGTWGFRSIVFPRVSFHFRSLDLFENKYWECAYIYYLGFGRHILYETWIANRRGWTNHYVKGCWPYLYSFASRRSINHFVIQTARFHLLLFKQKIYRVQGCTILFLRDVEYSTSIWVLVII